MDGFHDSSRELSFGEIVVGPEEEVSFRHPAASLPLRGISRKFTWRPPEYARHETPLKFALPLQCFIGPDGLRRIFPAVSWTGFRELASAGGLAILCQRQNFSEGQRYSYRAMRFLFRRTKGMAEHFGQSFQHSRDLFIAGSARNDPREMDILPPDVGLDDRDRGERWSVRELTRHGAEKARAAGWSSPTSEQRIQFGLMEAARLRPLVVPVTKALMLVRSALFDVGQTFDKLDPELIEMVSERTLEAMDRHLQDDSPRFDQWFGGPKSSFVHQIAKKKKSRGGELEEDRVREALLFLGWQAHQYVSKCLHAQMRTVQNALPVTLTEREKLIFEHTYLPQPYLGDLPLALLIDRFDVLKGILGEMWEQLPDIAGLVPVFHRLLDYYSTMAVRRREVDRQRKRRRPRPLLEAACGRTVQSDLFQDAAAAVRELRSIACRCGRPEWRAELKGQTKKLLTIGHACMNCDHKAETTVSSDEFAQLVL
jgi:hypothetical protein